MNPDKRSSRPAFPGRSLFVAVLLVYSVCPPFTSFDSYWTVPTALSILRHGTTAVDRYVASAPPVSYYAVERGPDGHFYNHYPEAVPVMALPIIAVIQFAAAVLARCLPLAQHFGAHPVVAAFLSGDLVGGHALAELWCAAVFGAVTVWLQYRIAARFLPVREALLVALLFAFGTSEWSIASRNLMQHGPTLLLLSLALYLILDGHDAIAALPLAMAFCVRPSNAISVAAFTVYVAVHHRAKLVAFVLWALPVAVPFFAYNLLVRHAFLPSYFYATPERYPALAGLAMHLVSPSRGLLIFTPVFVVSLAGIAIALRDRWCFPVTLYLVAILIAHTALIASMWEGHGYGSRYFADITYVFVFFLIPAILYWQKMGGRARTAAAALFFLLAAWGGFVHARGATSIAANQWSALPVNVDTAKWRVWDWSDPQFLRGL